MFLHKGGTNYVLIYGILRYLKVADKKSPKQSIFGLFNGRGRRPRTLCTRFFFHYLIQFQRFRWAYQETYNNIFVVILSYFPIHSTNLLLCNRMKIQNNKEVLLSRSILQILSTICLLYCMNEFRNIILLRKTYN